MIQSVFLFGKIDSVLYEFWWLRQWPNNRKANTQSQYAIRTPQNTHLIRSAAYLCVSSIPGNCCHAYSTCLWLVELGPCRVLVVPLQGPLGWVALLHLTSRLGRMLPKKKVTGVFRKRFAFPTGAKDVDNRGIDPRASRMLSERSTIWASLPHGYSRTLVANPIKTNLIEASSQKLVKIN